MTEPRPDGPYTDSIRSDSSSGIGGLWTLLASFGAGLAALPQIAEDLRYLVGDPSTRPADWEGLAKAIGTMNPEGDFNLRQLLQNIQLYVDLTSGYASQAVINLLYVTSFIDKPGPEGGFWNINDIVQQLISANAGLTGLQAQINSTNQVLGDVEDAPTGSTMKDLLRSIDINQLRAADCCEENGNQEPPTETQPPGPEDSCPLSGGPLRTTGYFFWRNLPAEELDEYIPLWEGLEAASSGLVAPLNSFDAAPIPAIYAPEFQANVCFEWNLLDGQVPGQLAQYRSSSTGEFVGETPTLISVTIGGGSSSVYLLDPEDRPRVFTVRVAEGSGAPTHNNYWLRWEANPV